MMDNPAEKAMKFWRQVIHWAGSLRGHKKAKAEVREWASVASAGEKETAAVLL